MSADDWRAIADMTGEAFVREAALPQDRRSGPSLAGSGRPSLTLDKATLLSPESHVRR
jgi:hypothetical protein